MNEVIYTFLAMYVALTLFISANLTIDGVYHDYLDKNSAPYQAMSNGGKTFYIFLMWIFSPVWLILWGLKIVLQGIFNFCMAFIRQPRKQFDLDALKKEIDDLCKSREDKSN